MSVTVDHSVRTFRRRRALVALIVALAAVYQPQTAQAQDEPPSDATIAQYIEQVPTSSGPRVARGGKRAAALPARVQRRLRAEAGDEASVLEDIATSTAYGAPDRVRRGGSAGTPETSQRGKSRDHKIVVPEIGARSALGEAATPKSAREGVLVVILALATASALVAAIVIRRRA